MKEIISKCGCKIFVDDDYYQKLVVYKWYIDKEKPQKGQHTKYASAHVNRRRERMHRVIMGCIPNDGKMVDHIDGNGLNNQIGNLRFCTQSTNQKNKRASGTSKYLGVSWHTTKTIRWSKRQQVDKVYYSSRWLAHIFDDVSKKQIHLGRFKNEIDAAAAYNKAAIKYHGEFARLNDVGL